MLVAAMSTRDINFPLNNTRFRNQVSTYSREEVNISDSEVSTNSSLSSDDEEDDSEHLQTQPRKIPSNYSRKAPYTSQISATKSTFPQEKSSPDSTSKNWVHSDEDLDYSLKPVSRPIKADSQGQPVYCFCRNGYDGVELMVECDGCQEWFHGECVGLTPDDSSVDQHHYCTVCLTSLNRSMLHPGSVILSEDNKIQAKRLSGCSKRPQSPEVLGSIVKLEASSDLEETIDVLEDDFDGDGDDICPVCELECTCGMGSNVKKVTSQKDNTRSDSNLTSRKKAPTRRRRLSISALSITTDSDDSEDKKEWTKSRRKTKLSKRSKARNPPQSKRKSRRVKSPPRDVKKDAKSSKSEGESDTNLVVDIEVDDPREDELESLSCVSSDFVDIEGLTDSSETLDSDDMPEIPLEFNENTVEIKDDLVEEPPFTRSGWESSSFEEYSDFPSGWSDTESSDSAESQSDISRLLMGETHHLSFTADYDSHSVMLKSSIPFKSISGFATTSESSSDFATANNSTLTTSANSILMSAQQLDESNSASLKPLSPSLSSEPCLSQQFYSRSNVVNETSSGLPTSTQPRLHPQTSCNSIAQVGKRRRNSSTAAEMDLPTIIPIDEVVDTEKLYSSSSSRSPSPEPSSKQYQEYLQALSRWDRIPIGTFRRSRRRTSAPKLSVSSAMKTPNTTLLSDHTLNVAKKNSTGKIVINHGCSPLLYPVLDSHIHNAGEYEEGREVNPDADPLLALFCVSTNDDILEDPPNTLERVKGRKRKRNRRRR